jgi:hypothetical protein
MFGAEKQLAHLGETTMKPSIPGAAKISHVHDSLGDNVVLIRRGKRKPSDAKPANRD